MSTKHIFFMFVLLAGWTTARADDPCADGQGSDCYRVWENVGAGVYVMSMKLLQLKSTVDPQHDKQKYGDLEVAYDTVGSYYNDVLTPIANTLQSSISLDAKSCSPIQTPGEFSGDSSLQDIWKAVRPSLAALKTNCPERRPGGTADTVIQSMDSLVKEF